MVWCRGAASEGERDKNISEFIFGIILSFGPHLHLAAQFIADLALGTWRSVAQAETAAASVQIRHGSHPTELVGSYLRMTQKILNEFLGQRVAKLLQIASWFISQELVLYLPIAMSTYLPSLPDPALVSVSKHGRAYSNSGSITCT